LKVSDRIRAHQVTKEVLRLRKNVYLVTHFKTLQEPFKPKLHRFNCSQREEVNSLKLTPTSSSTQTAKGLLVE